MKNKKGFTLAELIVVITIVGLIALIVTPLVINNMKESKNKLYETQLDNIKSAAKAYMVDLDLEDNVDSITVTLSDLKKSGLVEKDIKDPRNGNLLDDCMYIVVKKDLNNKNVYDYNIVDDNENKCNANSDIQLILLGNVEIKVIKEKKYIEPGVIVKTQNGKMLDINKVTVDVVKKTKEGKVLEILENRNYNELSDIIETSDEYQYDITYTYDGSEGKDSKIRHVKVEEEYNLQCVIVPEGTFNSNGWITNSRNVKIISVNTNKKVQYSISTTGEKKYSNNQVIDVGKDGETEIIGYIKDDSGHETVCRRVLKFEIGQPSCVINLEGKQEKNNWYSSDVKAKLQVNSIISEIVEKGVSLNKTKEYTGNNDLNVTASGKVYGYVKDASGKEISCNSNIKIDKTKSITVSISGTLEGTSTSYQAGTVVTSNVVLKGIVNPSTTVSGYSYQWYKDGKAISGAKDITYTATEDGDYKLRVETGSGITKESSAINVKIDKARPTCSLSVTSGIRGRNDWYTSDVTVTAKNNEATYYGMTNTNGVNYNSKTSVSLSSTGTAYCYVASRTKVSTNSNKLEIKIDKKAPTINSLTGTSLDSSGYNTTNLRLTAVANDSESGIDRYEFYRVSQNYSEETALNNCMGTSNICQISNPSGGYDYKVKVYDKAGLVSEQILKESCSRTNEGVCSGGARTEVYTCTTGRVYTATTSVGCQTTTAPRPSGGGSSGGGSSSGGSSSGGSTNCAASAGCSWRRLRR